MLYKSLIISLFLLSWRAGFTQDPVTYIRNYQDIAIAEMVRSGIPASIKLAQAILESSCGKSDLACKANNHFGIKCGGSWSGKSYHKEDDDYADGKLVKSCFREFNSVMESYIAHSDFLADPGKAGRYGPLFDLERTDYKGWAKGLSKAGYATDPQYANRLIEIIEKYELYRYDNEYENHVASNAPPSSSGRQIIKQTNDVKYTMALKGDNAEIIARRNGISTNQLRRFNDNIFGKEEALETGTRIYLEPKKSKYHGKQKYHVIKSGEDMAYVSMLYGIKLDALTKRNGLKNNEVPMTNQRIMLKGKPKSPVKTVDPFQVPGQKKSGDRNPTRERMDELVHSGSDQALASTTNSAPVTKGNTSSQKSNVQHTVIKGDTLYGIARNYGVSVDDLRKMNNLAVDTIYVGQKLVWK
jgi:LysM repeat protein